jgi:hypothetical protein
MFAPLGRGTSPVLRRRDGDAAVEEPGRPELASVQALDETLHGAVHRLCVVGVDAILCLELAGVVDGLVVDVFVEAQDVKQSVWTTAREPPTQPRTKS